MVNREEDRLVDLDLVEAVHLLASPDFECPAESEVLWEEDDGLPVLEDSNFAQVAGQFLSVHPIPLPEEGEVVWDVPFTASRQCKCLAYLATANSARRLEIARLCVAQALRLYEILPPRTGSGAPRREIDRAFYAACGTQCLIGALLRNHDAARRWCTVLGLTSPKGPAILFPSWINTRGGLADGSQDQK
jgi:hypothetical protein